MPDNVQIAKDFLEANGYVVLRAKSYRQAQERQHIAEARAEWAEELRAGQDRWMREEVFPEERRLRERLTFVYGVARAHGATVEELSVPAPVVEFVSDEGGRGAARSNPRRPRGTHPDKTCPICEQPVGSVDGCPCCEQWRAGIDTNGKPREQ